MTVPENFQVGIKNIPSVKDWGEVKVTGTFFDSINKKEKGTNSFGNNPESRIFQNILEHKAFKAGDP